MWPLSTSRRLSARFIRFLNIRAPQPAPPPMRCAASCQTKLKHTLKEVRQCRLRRVACTYRIYAVAMLHDIELKLLHDSEVLADGAAV